MGGEGIYSFTTLAHAYALIDICSRINKALVIGGGFIGLKAAEGLHDRGVQVEVVELSSRVLSTTFDDIASSLVIKRLTDLGIGIHCNVSAKAILRNTTGKVTGVLLSDGRELAAEAVVMAVGVVPDVSLAKSIGLTVRRGILVNEYLQTSNTTIFAAGDVAEGYDMLTYDECVMPIWPNAYRQGYCAGLNMVYPYQSFQGCLAMNAITFYGLPTISMGTVNPPAENDYKIISELNQQLSVYRKLVFRGDKLVGYVLVGDIDQAGLYTGFIHFQIPITDEVRIQLKDGRPSSLLWPEDFFDSHWNLDLEEPFTV
ncbi:hypothetical protein DSUL_160061 [Desulfovibrionales bacterium]